MSYSIVKKEGNAFNPIDGYENYDKFEDAEGDMIGLYDFNKTIKEGETYLNTFNIIDNDDGMLIHTEEKILDDGTEELMEDNSSQEMTNPFDPTKIQIITKQDSIQNIVNRIRNYEIDWDTDFQRSMDLWSAEKMSLLIESILIRFPLPAFYFDASDDNKWLVVDGLQRLSAIKKFVIDNDLKLKHLEYLEKDKEVFGKTYKDLPRHYQRRIDECPVTLFLIQPGTPVEVKYNVFKRINTGGLVLNSQEIRNAMAKERERNFLKTLSHSENMKNIFGKNSYKRMKAQELVLRFFAFYMDNYKENSKSRISLFLDDAIEKLKQKKESELIELSSIFTKTLYVCYEIFGNSAFEKKSLYKNTTIKNSSLFEALMVSISRISDEYTKILVGKKNLVTSKLNELMINDKDFSDSISFAVNKKENFTIRHKRINNLINEVLND